MSINRIESLIPFAHASITAEGDSAVLMQKVSKEYVDDYSKNLLFPPSYEKPDLRNNIFTIDCLFNLIKYREALLLKLLTEKTIKNSKSIYQVWMLEESDLIQDLAFTYGERTCLEESIIKIKGSK